MRRWIALFLAPLLSSLSSYGCDDTTPDSEHDAGAPDAGPHDAGPHDASDGSTHPDGFFCTLPGSVRRTPTGMEVVPGGATPPDLSWLHVPIGFCVHYYGNVGNPRQLRFAPGGELFVASPTTTTTGGGPNGRAAIVVMPDDNQDGVADDTITFLSNLPSTQGLLFTPGQFYYQDGTRIMRMPYKAGDRKPSGPSAQVVNITMYSSSLHWPKTLDVADDGTIYVANGGDQSEPCNPARPFHGGILKLDGTPGGKPVAKGLRNPIGVRCARGHNLCFAVELAKDYSSSQNGREKLLPIRQGDDWGFPCCASEKLPYTDVTPVPDCSGVVGESGSFIIGNTPFDLDFAPDSWPAPWKNRAFVPLHGEAGTWNGARLVAIEMNEKTGLPVASSDLGGQPPGGMADFATGWDDKSMMHGRPAEVAFAPDGRLFLSNDTNGDIVWIAPFEL